MTQTVNNKLKVWNRTFFEINQEKMKNENKIVFRELDFGLSKISDPEIKFSRKIVDEIIELQDFIGEFEIQTDPSDLKKFIIYVVREYDTFQNDLLNHLTIS